MNILVINSGSSSLKFRLVKVGKNFELLAKGHFDGIGKNNCKFSFSSPSKNIGQKHAISSHKIALSLALKTISQSGVIKNLKEINAIGHRVVHGGEKFTKAVKIDQKVIKELQKLIALAPLHNPANIEGIVSCKKLLPKTPQIAVFDTAYHQSMPEKAFLYALPYKFYKKHSIRRYGFHGTSHKYVTNEAIKLIKKKNPKIISIHLGNGSSITASLNGKVVDTSMGLTPLEGLPMGTRSGTIDPAIIFHLEKELKLKSKKIEKILLHESGLKGLSGLSNDMRDIYAKSLKKDKQALLTIEYLSYQIAKYIGAYTASLKGCDAIIFTGGLGEKAFYVREQACNYLEYLGLKLDKKKNKNCESLISTSQSKIKIFVIETNEEKQIALETLRVQKVK